VTITSWSIMDNVSAVRFLALGDSYTIGEGVTPEERWPVKIVFNLKNRGIPISELTIIARTGWTTAELQAAIEEANPQGDYQLVSLLIGVNNQYRGLDPAEYRREFVTLIERAIHFAGGQAERVLIVSIPDWGVTPFADGRDRAQITAEINTFNDINRTESEKREARYVDITPNSRNAVHDPDLVAPDGLHPSGKMYAEWVEIFSPVVISIVGKRYT